jgi:hypothetical protein
LKAKCSGRHTQYQPSDDKFQCPQCGEQAKFYVDAWDESNDPACTLLHVDDVVCCERCGGMWSGRTLTSIWVRQEKLMTCPTCKGKGHVRKDGTVDVDSTADDDDIGAELEPQRAGLQREPLYRPAIDVLDMADGPQLSPALRASVLMARTYANSFDIASPLPTETPEAFVQRVSRSLLSIGRGTEALEIMAGGRFPDEQAARVDDFLRGVAGLEPVDELES